MPPALPLTTTPGLPERPEPLLLPVPPPPGLASRPPVWLKGLVLPCHHFERPDNLGARACIFILHRAPHTWGHPATSRPPLLPRCRGFCSLSPRQDQGSGLGLSLSTLAKHPRPL